MEPSTASPREIRDPSRLSREELQGHGASSQRKGRGDDLARHAGDAAESESSTSHFHHCCCMGTVKGNQQCKGKHHRDAHALAARQHSGFAHAYGASYEPHRGTTLPPSVITIMRSAGLVFRFVVQVCGHSLSSHAGEDKHLAYLIYDKMTRRGFRPFVDPGELRVGGCDAISEMEEALATAPAVVFILSPEYFAKRYPMLELRTSLSREEEYYRTASTDKGFKSTRPVLFPVFFRLSAAECEEGKWQDWNWVNTFALDRLVARIAAEEGIGDGLLHDLRKIATHNGVMSTSGLSHETLNELSYVELDKLVDEICDGIEKALRSARIGVDPQILERALRQGKKRLDTVRLMVLGASSRGKTSTITSLRGEPFDDENCTSTVGIDLSIHHVAVGNNRLSAQQKNYLDKRDKFPAKFRAFAEGQHQEAQNQDDGAVTVASRDITSEARAAPGENEQVGRPALREHARRSVPSDILRLDLTEELHSNVSVPDCVTLRCWDFGGQPEYEVAHELFISPRSMIMLVFDLPRFENERTREEEARELHHWLQTVFAATPEVDLDSTFKSLVIVGTKRDSCKRPQEVPAYFKRLRNLLTDYLDGGVTNRWKMRDVKMIAIENRTATVQGKAEASGLTELEGHLHETAKGIIARSEEVPLKWLGFLESLRLQDEENEFLSMTQREVEERIEEFYFSSEQMGMLNVEAYNCLKYFRNLGEIVLLETSRTDDTDAGNSSYILFLSPERILQALKVIVAPEYVRCDGLSRREDRERLRKGEITPSALEEKWGDLAGLSSKVERDKLVALMTSMDIFITLQPTGQLWVPSLLKRTWDDLKWLQYSSNTEREVSAMTRFEGCIPFGFVGTIVGRLHRRMGDEQTDVRLIRANAVLLTLGKGHSECEHWQIFVGFDQDNGELHWKVRGPRWNFGLLGKCLSEFEDHKKTRLVRRVSCTHFLLADCPRRCSDDKFRLQFEIPFGRIEEEICSSTENRTVIEAQAWWRKENLELADVSRMCDAVVCENTNCNRSATLYEAMCHSAPSKAPGILRLPSNRTHTVFVSHAGPDKRTIAFPLHEALRARGISSFVDEKEMRPGDEAVPAMIKAMNTAPILVVIASPEFCARVWTMKELRCFYRRDAEAKAKAKRSGSYPAWLLRILGDIKSTETCQLKPGEGGRPIIIPVFYRLSCEQCRYLKVSTDVTDEDPYSMRRFRDMLDNQDPALGEIRECMRALAGFMGVRNDTGATNEDTTEMEGLRGQIVSQTVEAVERFLHQIR